MLKCQIFSCCCHGSGAHVFPAQPGNEIWPCFSCYINIYATSKTRHYWNRFQYVFLLLLYFILRLSRICFYQTKVLRNNTTDLLSDLKKNFLWVAGASMTTRQRFSLVAGTSGEPWNMYLLAHLGTLSYSDWSHELVVHTHKKSWMRSSNKYHFSSWVESASLLQGSCFHSTCSSSVK